MCDSPLQGRKPVSGVSSSFGSITNLHGTRLVPGDPPPTKSNSRGSRKSKCAAKSSSWCVGLPIQARLDYKLGMYESCREGRSSSGMSSLTSKLIGSGPADGGELRRRSISPIKRHVPLTVSCGGLSPAKRHSDTSDLRILTEGGIMQGLDDSYYLRNGRAGNKASSLCGEDGRTGFGEMRPRSPCVRARALSSSASYGDLPSGKLSPESAGCDDLLIQTGLNLEPDTNDFSDIQRSRRGNRAASLCTEYGPNTARTLRGRSPFPKEKLPSETHGSFKNLVFDGWDSYEEMESAMATAELAEWVVAVEDYSRPLTAESTHDQGRKAISSGSFRQSTICQSGGHAPEDALTHPSQSV